MHINIGTIKKKTSRCLGLRLLKGLFWENKILKLTWDAMKLIKTSFFLPERLGALNMLMYIVCITVYITNISYAAFHSDEEPYKNL